MAGLITFSACNYPQAGSSGVNTSTPDQNTIGTAAAQTLDAQMATMTAEVKLTPGLLNPIMPTSQSPVTLRTETPPVATEPPPAVTQPPPMTTQSTPAAPSQAMVVATANTNCRMGPSPIYPAVGLLGVSQSSPALGRNDSNTWWFINNPANPSVGCWVWGQTTQVQGNAALLPVITPPVPPPPPSAIPNPGKPSFTAAYETIHACGILPYVVFQVTNKGGEPLFSMRIKVKEIGGKNISTSQATNAPFIPAPGSCPPGGSELGPGVVAFVAGAIPQPFKPGATMQAAILLCTQPNQGGICIESKVHFVAP